MDELERQKILLANLLECDRLYSNITESKELHLHELWESLNLPSKRSREDLLAAFKVYQYTLASSEPQLNVQRMLSFCNQVVSGFALDDMLKYAIPNYVGRHHTIPSASIAYWRDNRDSVLAYSHFKGLFKSAAPIHVDRFNEICDTIIGGEADFGILPIENSSDGKLFGFYRMLEKNDLNICATLDIDHPDMDAHTRYALISRHSVFFENISPLQLELFFYSTDNHELAELMCVAQTLAISISRIDSLPLRHQNDGFRGYITVSLTPHYLAIFLCYLWLFKTDYLVLGLYIHIEKD